MALRLIARVPDEHYLQNAPVGIWHFATVITILSWFYLQSDITLLDAQLNVVLKRRFYPRSLVDAPSTPADQRVLDAYAAERAYHPEQRVGTRIEK